MAAGHAQGLASIVGASPPLPYKHEAPASASQESAGASFDGASRTRPECTSLCTGLPVRCWFLQWRGMMKGAYRGLAVFLGIPLLTYLGQSMSSWSAPRFLRWPSLVLQEASVLTIFLLLGMIVAIPCYAFFAIWRWRNADERRRCGLSALACFGWCVLYLLALYFGGEHRDRSFTRVAQTATPVVEAIERFEVEHGNYPRSLEELTPQYLADTPYTGLIAYPTFTYSRRQTSLAEPEFQDGYELRIECSSGALNFDRFIYWPSGEYPARIQGNRIERIGDWAYVHE